MPAVNNKASKLDFQDVILPLLMAVFGVVLCRFGIRLDEQKQKDIIDFIEKNLQAKKTTTPF